MKRFWTDVAVTPTRGVTLDGKPVRTPGRVSLVLPTDALAQAVAEEWRGVVDTIDPRAMPLTGLANAAIERVAADPAGFAQELARYGESDLLCYRADAPANLVARQASLWDPPLAWARGRYDVHFTIVTGIVHRPQPSATIARLGAAVATYDAFALAALSPMVTLGGSLVLALAVAEGAMTADDAWRAAQLDEDWQAEQWGVDTAAADLRRARAREFAGAVWFLDLSRT